MGCYVLDLEMCKVNQNREYRHHQEIIQVGICYLNDDLEEEDSFREYVRPQYGEPDAQIEALTGIKKTELDHADLLEEVLGHLLVWMNGREGKICTWSGCDRGQLDSEIRSKKLRLAGIDALMEKGRWVDIQKRYIGVFHSNSGPSLSEALDHMGIIPEGRLHDGLEDARSTGKLMKKLKELFAIEDRL